MMEFKQLNALKLYNIAFLLFLLNRCLGFNHLLSKAFSSYRLHNSIEFSPETQGRYMEYRSMSYSNNKPSNLLLSSMSPDAKYTNTFNSPILADTIPVDHNSSTSVSDIYLSNLTLHYFKSKGFTTLTPIQSKSFDHVISGKDLVIRAKPGSGKTLAFTLPLIEKIYERRSNKSLPVNSKPLVLIIEPTRDLVNKVRAELFPLIYFHGLRLAAFHGGVPIENQESIMLAGGFDIVVSTPGRIYDLMEKGLLSLNSFEHCILDDGDYVVEPRFQYIVEHIFNKIKSDREFLIDELSEANLEMSPITFDENERKVAINRMISSPDQSANILDNEVQVENISQDSNVVTSTENLKNSQSFVDVAQDVFNNSQGDLMIDTLNSDLNYSDPLNQTSVGDKILSDDSEVVNEATDKPKPLTVSTSMQPLQTIIVSSSIVSGWIEKLVRRYLNNPIFLDGSQDAEFKVSKSINHIAVRIEPSKNILPAINSVLHYFVLRYAPGKQSIIFATKAEANQLYETRNFGDLRVEFLHGDISPNHRQKIFQLFKRGLIDVLIATDTAVRNLEMFGVDLVINTRPPLTPEMFVSRSNWVIEHGTSIMLYAFRDDIQRLGELENVLNFQFELMNPPTKKDISYAKMYTTAKNLERIKPSKVESYLDQANLLVKCLSEGEYKVPSLTELTDAEDPVQMYNPYQVSELVARCLAHAEETKIPQRKSLITGDINFITFQMKAKRPSKLMSKSQYFSDLLNVAKNFLNCSDILIGDSFVSKDPQTQQDVYFVDIDMVTANTIRMIIENDPELIKTYTKYNIFECEELFYYDREYFANKRKFELATKNFQKSKKYEVKNVSIKENMNREHRNSEENNSTGYDAGSSSAINANSASIYDADNNSLIDGNSENDANNTSLLDVNSASIHDTESNNLYSKDAKLDTM